MGTEDGLTVEIRADDKVRGLIGLDIISSAREREWFL
jgi:hypothetical protein